MTDYKVLKYERIRQGDIFKNIEYLEDYKEQEGFIEVKNIVFPYVIVLTQDCDLDQDYNFRDSKNKKKTQDKIIISILVAPLYNSDHLIVGDHLSKLELKMFDYSKGSKTKIDDIKNNNNPRYHYLEFDKKILIVNSIIDFKHYFSINIEKLIKVKEEKYVCSIKELYREDISQRFSSFLSRIGLP